MLVFQLMFYQPGELEKDVNAPLTLCRMTKRMDRSTITINVFYSLII